MAINADKLLNKSSGRLAMQKAQQEKMIGGGPSNIVLSKKSIKGIESIKINVIKIEDILKGSLALDKKQLDDKKKATSGKRRENIETKLETKPNVESGKVKMPSAPRMGILDFIKNFIGNVLLGYFAVRLIKHLPKIMPIVKFLGNAADFIINTGGFLLNGLATFLDIGYKAYDATRGFLKSFGGENFAKGFDKFIGAIDTALFLTTVLAGSMALEAMSGGGGGPGGGRGGEGNKTYSGGRQRGFSGNQGSTLAKRRVLSGGSRGFYFENSNRDIMKRYFQKYGRDQFIQRFGQDGLKKLPGGMARSGATNLARKGLVGLAGKGGAKMVLGFARPLLKRLPIIGALIDFGLSVALGEDPGRAAFKAIGAGLLGTVGAAIGSLAFGFGGIVGGILGSIGGDALGGALYDTFFGGKKPQQKGKVQGKAGGGITRGGRSRGRVKRTLSKGKYKRVLAPQKPSKTEFKDKEVKKSTEELDKTKYFGPILAISSKIMNKEEPTDRDYQNVGLGINLLIAKGIQDGQLKGGIVAKFAGGGLVDPDVLSAAETGGDISNWVAKTFRGQIETGAQKTMRLMKEMREKNKPAGVPGAGQPGDPSLINIQGGDADFWTLVAVASREDGDPQSWADVAQSVYNRLASGAYSGKTIKELILGQMQYEPTWKFPRAGVRGKPNQEWYAIKDAASAGAAAGQSEDAMKKVAAALLDSNLQKNARELIQGRTDFRGYSVSGGIQRKSGDNYYGWYNNYRANKIGSIPNFGATATSTPGGPGPSIALGAGYGSGGSKIAGELGDYMKQVKIPTGEIHQHPRHPGLSKRSYFSYHNQGRAIDLGGYGPAHPSSGGRDEQAPILRALVAWNKQKGVTPVEVIHGSSAFRGFGKYESAPNALHSHHVHVAYAKGGRIYKLTRAILGEKGQEFVFDYDTTRGLDSLAPLLLDKLNTAKTKPQLANILQSYADYERPYPESQDRIVEVPVLLPPPLPSSEQVLVAVGGGRGGGNGSSYTDGLYAG
jgi:hypothetical protein